MSAVSTSTITITEISNLLSVLAVLVCFCAMVLFVMRNIMVLRVHGDDVMFRAPLHRPVAPPRAPQIKMMKVHIPFTFRLRDSSKSTYAEVQCSVTSQVHYTLRAFWGVSIRELHAALWRPWGQLRDALSMGALLAAPHCQYRAPEIRDGDHSEQTLRLHLPPPAKLRLGTPPRLCYPLVVLLTRDDEPDRLQSDDTVALVNVVHIRDSVCPLPTSVLAQYLKQANGQLSCLKQLYLATGNPATYEVSEPSCEQLCAVCQAFPLSRALLPCRHTCVCANCFNKLDRCPICRSPIHSYFCIRGEDYLPMEVNSVPEKSAFRWLDSWNDRLTDFLGFR